MIMSWNRSLLNFVDRITERKARKAAQVHGRRSFVGRLGMAMVGGAILPMLPFDRSARAAEVGDGHKHGDASQDSSSCEYWRLCALDGYRCGCCGGTDTSCPPGTEPSKVSWVGTCFNPADKRQYLVSYSDCCGKGTCGNCQCSNSHGERPGYKLGIHNDINWCMANSNTMINCTTATVVGAA
jgi:methylamine dehydrogenase light chain